MNWRTETEYIDIDTGEVFGVFDKTRFKNEWEIVKTTKKTEINGQQGIIRRTIECRRNGQGRLEGF